MIDCFVLFCTPLGIDKYDCEGRLIVAEYENFYFLTSCELVSVS